LEPPKPGDKIREDIQLSVQDEPYIQSKLLRDKRIRLYLRNHGLGWLVFNLPVDTACALRDFLIANTPKESIGQDFFLSQDSGGDISH